MLEHSRAPTLHHPHPSEQVEFPELCVLKVDRRTEHSQLFVQVLLTRLAGFGLTLSRQHLTLSSRPQTEARRGLMEHLGHILLQGLHVL